MQDIHIADNTIQPGKDGVLCVEPDCARISFVGNQVAGREQKSEDIAGQRDLVLTESPQTLPPVGPAALPLDGALHLKIAKLSAWCA